MLVNSVRFRRVTLVAIAAMTSAACGGDSTAPGSTPAVFVRLPAESLFMGRSMQMIAAATGDSATVAWPTFGWHSSDTTIAVVDSTGIVLGLNPGTATIRAELNGVRDSIAVRVVLQRVDQGIAFASVSRGFFQHCALSTAGTAYCRSTVAGDTVDKYAALPGGDGIALTALHTTTTHKCGTTAVGVLYCWGSNSAGQFLTGSKQPASASSAPAAGGGTMRFSAITVGTNSSAGYTCGVSSADSIVYCAGQNQSQQLGHAGTSSADTIVTPVTGSFRATALTASPVFSSYTCAIALTRFAYCWGSNSGGVSGVGTGATPRLISSSIEFTAISSGQNHMCGIAVIGSVFCWGQNLHGQLGIDTTETATHSSPEAAHTSLLFGQIASGNGHTCAVTTTGALYCWGDFPPAAISSRLGILRYRPYQLARGITFRSVSTDNTHICGVTTDQKILCF